MVDGKEGKPYDKIGSNSPTFRPDSEHVAYETKEGDHGFVVVDGKESSKAYDIFYRDCLIWG